MRGNGADMARVAQVPFQRQLPNADPFCGALLNMGCDTFTICFLFVAAAHAVKLGVLLVGHFLQTLLIKRAMPIGIGR